MTKDEQLAAIAQDVTAARARLTALIAPPQFARDMKAILAVKAEILDLERKRAVLLRPLPLLQRCPVCDCDPRAPSQNAEGNWIVVCSGCSIVAGPYATALAAAECWNAIEAAVDEDDEDEDDDEMFEDAEEV